MRLRNKSLNSESFSNFFHNIPIPTFAWEIVGEDLVLIGFNDATEKLSFEGVSLGIKASELFKDEGRILTNLLSCLNEKSNFSEECEYRMKKTGEQKKFSTSFIFLPPDLIILHIEDLTMQTQVNKALQKAHDALTGLELIINQSPAVVFLVRDEEGWPVEYITENISQFGYEPSDFYSHMLKFADIIHPDDLGNVITDIYLKGQSSATEFVQEYRIVSKLGEYRWINVRTWIKRNRENSITHFQGIILDITERRQTEEKLKASDEKFRTITEQSLLGVAILQKGKVEYINKALAEMAEFEPNEVKNWPINEFMKSIYPEDLPLVMENMQVKLEENREAITRYTFRILTKSKKIKWLEIISKTISYQGDLAILSTLIDITEKKEAEIKLQESEENLKNLNEALEQKVLDRTEDLKKSEEKWRSMAKNSPDFLLTLDRDERIIDINKIELLSLKMKDVIDKPVYDFIPEKYHESAKYCFKRVFKSGQNDRYYSDFVYDDATIHYFENRVGPILKEGIVVGFSVSSTDITERKKAEEELKKFKSISDNANYGIGISDNEGKLVYTNNYFASIHGYKTDELMGKDLSIFHNDKQIERVMKLKQKLLEEGSYNAEEVGHTRKNGTMFPMLMNGITINDDKGKPLFMATTAIDITEIKEAEKKLKESVEKFRNIADQSLMGICILQDDVIKYANQRMADINGYNLEEIMNWQPKEFNKIISSESLDFVAEQAKKKQLGLPGAIPQYQLQIIKKSGEKIWVENFSKTINFNGRPADLVTFFDITDKKKVEQRLKESEAKFSTAIESLPFPFYMLDESGRYIMQNTNAKKTWGNLIGKTPKDIANDGKTLSIWLNNNSRAFSGETIANKAKYDIKGESRYFYDIIAPVYVGTKIKNILGVNIDITEQKHAEQELKESEEKFRNITDQSLMAISIMQDDVIKYANQRLADLNGYSLEEIMNWQPKEFYKTITTESLDFVAEQAKIKQLDLPGAIPHNTLQIIKKSGEKIWIDSYSKTINFKGRPAVLATFFDITDKKKVEQELKESEEILRATLESTADGILVVDDKGQVTHTNSKFVDMWHISQELIEERDDQKLLDYVLEQLKDPEVFISNVEQLYRSSKEDFDTLYFKDGRIFERFSNPLIREGEINGRVWSFRDVTERKKAEQKLKESEEKYRLISENANDLISIVDDKWKFVYCNEAYERVLGYNHDELIGTSGFNLIHPEDRNMAYKDFKYSLDTGLGRTEARLLCKDGTYKWMDSFGKIIYDKDGKFRQSIGISRDITERKRAEQKLIESELIYKEAYNRAEFYKDIFTHDINNILSNIKSSIELSAIYLKDPNRMTDVEELYGVIRGQFTKGASLVSNIRKLSQIDESVSLVKSVEINDILKKEIDFILNSYQTRDVKIRTHILEEGVLVNANDLLIDLFNNLLNNSIKYNESHVVEIDVKMSKEKKNNTNYVKLEFLDNGIGIPDKQKETLFEKEYSKDIASKGLGIGLTLVKKIVDSYRGEIWVEDRIKGDYSQGSNFIVLIPEA